jgi:hypothetical protein
MNENVSQVLMLQLVCFSSKQWQSNDSISKEPAVGRCALDLSLLLAGVH